MEGVSINWAAVAVATLLGFGLGGLWYSPLLFAKAWMRESGVTEAQTRQAPMGRIFGLTIVATAVMAVNLAAFIGPKASLAFGLFAGLAAGVGWVAMSLGVIYLFERRSFKLWLINSGYQVLCYALMGALLGVWK